MAVSRKTAMAIKSYQNQARALAKNYLLADPFMPYTSVLGGILLFKVVYSCLSVLLFSCERLKIVDLLFLSFELYV